MTNSASARRASGQNHTPRHTRSTAARYGKVQGRWMNPERGSPRLITVDDPDDFRAIHRNSKAVVLCAKDGCGSRLLAKTNKRGTRWLAAWPDTTGCHHFEVPLASGGGGPESPEHRWVNARLFRICVRVKLEPVLEHRPTYADVFVPGPDIALEYQRWDTKFAEREMARERAGARRVIWFFPRPPVGLRTVAEKSLAKAIRSRVQFHGGVYLHSAHKDDPRNTQRPWEHPDDREMNRTTRLYVSGSIATYDQENGGLRLAHVYGAHHFIAQVASGERDLRTVPVRLPSGVVKPARVWVRRRDLEKVHEAQKRRADLARAQAEEAARKQAEEAAREQEEAARLLEEERGLAELAHRLREESLNLGPSADSIQTVPAPIPAPLSGRPAAIAEQPPTVWRPTYPEGGHAIAPQRFVSKRKTGWSRIWEWLRSR